MSSLQKIGDKLAIFLSSVCMVHCVFTPLLLIAIPSIGGAFSIGHDTFHQIMLFFVIPVGVVALTMGYRRHRNLSVWMQGVGGLLILTFAALVGHDLLGEAGETLLTIAGSLFIVFAHLRNFQMHRQNSCSA